MLWYSLEAPRRGAFNEYHNIFLWRNKKNIMRIPSIIWSYAEYRETPFWTGKSGVVFCFSSGLNSEVVLFSSGLGSGILLYLYLGTEFYMYPKYTDT